MPLMLAGPAIPLGGETPAQYTCDGSGISPPLLAISRPTLELGGTPATAADVLRAAQPYVIQQTELVGTDHRSSRPRASDLVGESDSVCNPSLYKEPAIVQSAANQQPNSPYGCSINSTDCLSRPRAPRGGFGWASISRRHLQKPGPETSIGQSIA